MLPFRLEKEVVELLEVAVLVWDGRKEKEEECLLTHLTLSSEITLSGLDNLSPSSDPSMESSRASHEVVLVGTLTWDLS